MEQPKAGTTRKLCTKCKRNPRQKGQRWCRACRSGYMTDSRKAAAVPKPKKLDVLTPDPKNANLGTKRGRRMLQQSLQDLGTGRSILIDKDGVVIAGNKTLEQAKAAGIDEVVVIPSDGRKLIAVQRTDLSLADDPVAQKLAIADNRVAEIDLRWDDGVMANLADEGLLKDLFTEREIAALLAGKRPPGTATDEAPNLPKEPVTQLGDLIILGDHRLKCGDATDSAVMTDALGDEGPASMCWTDPPYNVEYVGKTADALTIQNDAMPAEKFWEFLQALHRNIAAGLVDGAPVYVAHADSWGHLFRGAFIGSGILLKQCLIWAKDVFVMGRQDYQWQHEPILYGFRDAQKLASEINIDPWTHTPILYGWKPGAGHPWYSDRKQSTVLSFARPKRSDVHPTMKPVLLVEYCILNSTGAGKRVLDPCAGSGTTLMACESAGRRCISIELDPKYCDVIVERWQLHTGRKAQRPARS